MVTGMRDFRVARGTGFGKVPRAAMPISRACATSAATRFSVFGWVVNRLSIFCACSGQWRQRFQ